MKRKDITALHSLSIAELQKKLVELMTLAAKTRLEKKVGKVANKKAVTILNDDIARVKTVLREQEIVAARTPAQGAKA